MHQELEWMFGDKALHGGQAVMAGWVLIGLGVTFLALGVSYCRWAQERLLLRAQPWVLLVLDVVFYSYVLSVVDP